jgi:hypothetical protein
MAATLLQSPEETPLERQPEWADVAYVCHTFGLKGSFVWQLIRDRRVRSCVIPGRGRGRGKRVIDVCFFRKMLNELADAEGTPRA